MARSEPAKALTDRLVITGSPSWGANASWMAAPQGPICVNGTTLARCMTTIISTLPDGFYEESLRRGSNRGSQAGWKMESSPGNSCDAAEAVPRVRRPRRPNGNDAMAAAATPRPSLAKKLLRDCWEASPLEDFSVTIRSLFYQPHSHRGTKYFSCFLTFASPWLRGGFPPVRGPLSTDCNTQAGFCNTATRIMLWALSRPRIAIPALRRPRPSWPPGGPCAPSSWYPGPRGRSEWYWPGTGF